MRGSRPSFTARGVALARSQLPRPRTAEGDADAEQRLYAGLQTGLVRLLRGGGGRRLAGRTRFFDQETLRAVTGGVTQVSRPSGSRGVPRSSLARPPGSLDRAGWAVTREVRRSTRAGIHRLLVAADPARREDCES